MNDQDRLPAPSCEVPNDWRHRMEAQVSDIHRAVIGDPQLGHRGLVSRVESLEIKVERHEVKLITWAGICAGAILCYDYLKQKLTGS